MLDTNSDRDTGDGIQFTREGGATWSLIARQRVAVARDDLFPFFANAGNLARLTPPEVGFDIRTPLPIAMGVGTLIDYRIRLWGIPIDWRTAITAWNPPVEFVDVQLRGPYAEWVHTHRFIELAPNATLIEDAVRFRLPLGWIGAAGGPIVRRQLRRIFAFRRAVVAALPVDSALRRAR